MLIEQEREKLRAKREASQDRQKVNAASAIIIGNELNNPDPVSIIDFRIEKKTVLLLTFSLNVLRLTGFRLRKRKKKRENHAAVLAKETATGRNEVEEGCRSSS